MISKSWAKGSTTAWLKVRRFVMLRDAGKGCRAHKDGWCALASGEHECAGDNPAVVRHAHHVKGRRITGDDPQWIVASCGPCNLHIGDPTKHSPEAKRISRW